MSSIMDNKKDWKTFVNSCSIAYNIIRKNGDLLINLCMIMHSGKIDDL